MKFIHSEKVTKVCKTTFDCMYCSQKLGEDFAKFCGLLRIYELQIVGPSLLEFNHSAPQGALSSQTRPHSTVVIYEIT